MRHFFRNPTTIAATTRIWNMTERFGPLPFLSTFSIKSHSQYTRSTPAYLNEKQNHSGCSPSKLYTILLVIRWPIGGIRTWISYVYRHLDPTKYRLCMILPEYSEHSALIADLQRLNPLVFTLPPDYRPTDFIYTLIRVLISHNVDVIHSHGLTSAVYSSLPAKLARTPHVATLHEPLTESVFPELKNPIRRQLLALVLYSLDKIHCVGDDAKRNLLAVFPNLSRHQSRVIVIPGGIATEPIRDSITRDFRKELDLPNDTFLIGFLGRYMPPKGFRVLANALERLVRRNHLSKSPMLVLFENDGCMPEEIRYLQARNLTPYFRILPFTPHVGSTLKGLDVLVMPSFWEACPLLPMEAMVAGLPVIGTDCPGLREVLAATPSIICPTGDSEALASALKSQIDLPTRLQAESFRNKASCRFESRTTALSLMRLYTALLDGPE